MKKICFLVGDISFGGGAERITISVANLLVDRGREVCILSIADFKKEDLVYDISSKVILKSLFIKDWSNKGGIRKNYFGVVKSLRKSFIENNTDIVVSVQAINMLWVIPALIGLKAINICWEHINYNSHKSIIYDTTIFLAKKFAKKIVVLTERDRKAWGTKKAISISNFSAFNMPDVNLQEKQKVFIAIGRFAPQKAFDRLISAWEIVEKSGNVGDYHLHLIGEGEQEFFLRNMIKEKGLERIDIRPFTKQIDLVYGKASAILMTSLFEGYPMVLIEALQFGVPAVAFDVLTGPAEIILDNETGFLIEDGNIEEFSNCIIRLINERNLVNKLQVNALEHRKKFGSNDIIKNWDSVLN